MVESHRRYAVVTEHCRSSPVSSCPPDPSLNIGPALVAMDLVGRFASGRQWRREGRERERLDACICFKLLSRVARRLYHI